MGVTNSISHFTASLAGSLFGSLEPVRCDTRYVEKRPETDADAQKEQNKGSAESGSRTGRTSAGNLTPAPWLAADDRVQPDSALEDHEERQGREDEEKGENRSRDDTSTASEDTETRATKTSSGTDAGQAKLPGEELSDAEKEMILELKQRDAEVRAHEQAHVAAAAGNARGGPTYEYQTGPDGRQYAVGGSVALDISPVPGDPEATIEKAKAVRRAALAPAQPSSQDRAVAASASAMESEARTELADTKKGEPSSAEPEGGSLSPAPEGGGLSPAADEPLSPSRAEPASGNAGKEEADAPESFRESMGSEPVQEAESIQDRTGDEQREESSGETPATRLGRKAAQAYEQAMRFNVEPAESLNVAA